jgi:hypothetical protein
MLKAEQHSWEMRQAPAGNSSTRKGSRRVNVELTRRACCNAYARVWVCMLLYRDSCAMVSWVHSGDSVRHHR